MNSSINSSELLTDEEDWAKDSSGTSQLDIIIIIFTSLILGMMILTTIIGETLLYLKQYKHYVCLNKCQQNYGNYLELLATLQKHCQRSQFVVPRGNSPLHTIYYYYLHHFAMCTTTPSTSTSFNLQIFQQLNNLYF